MRFTFERCAPIFEVFCVGSCRSPTVCHSEPWCCLYQVCTSLDEASAIDAESKLAYRAAKSIRRRRIGKSDSDLPVLR